MTEEESLQIIRREFGAIAIDRIVVEYDPIVEEIVAKAHVRADQIEAASEDYGAIPRHAAMQAGISVEVVTSEK